MLLLILAFYIALSNYSLLPGIIPIHFGAQGIPDGWGSKRMIFLSPIVSAVIFILLSAFNVLLAIVNNPKRFITLPKRRKEALTEAQTETLRTFINRSFFYSQNSDAMPFHLFNLADGRTSFGQGKQPGDSFLAIDRRTISLRWLHGLEKPSPE